MLAMAEEKRAQRVARVCPVGTVLFRDGAEGNTMFVVQSGRVRLLKERNGVEKVVTELGAGEFFGEMAILNGKPRTATAVCVEDSRLIEIDAKTFADMITHSPEVAIRLVQRLATRLDQANALLDVLVQRDRTTRIVLGLASIAEYEGRDAPDGSIAIAGDAAGIAARLGLTEEEAAGAFRRLHRLQLVEETPDGLEIPNVVLLHEFLAYLERRAEKAA